MPAKYDSNNLPRALARRDFLKLAGASAAAVAVSFAGPGGARADGAPAIPVAIEELPLGEHELGAGTRDGLDWAAATGLQLSPGRAAGSYVSPVLHTDKPFTHIGLLWIADLPEAID